MHKNEFLQSILQDIIKNKSTKTLSLEKEDKLELLKQILFFVLKNLSFKNRQAFKIILNENSDLINSVLDDKDNLLKQLNLEWMVSDYHLLTSDKGGVKEVIQNHKKHNIIANFLIKKKININFGIDNYEHIVYDCIICHNQNLLKILLKQKDLELNIPILTDKEKNKFENLYSILKNYIINFDIETQNLFHSFLPKKHQNLLHKQLKKHTKTKKIKI